MPVIRFRRAAPSQAGDVPATGFFRFQLTKPRATVGDPDSVVTTKPFKAVLVGGAVDVDLAPTPDGFAWTVLESIDGIRDVTYYVTVPDVAGPLDDPDLVRANPSTLSPAAAPTAAWWASLEALRAQAAGGFVVDPADTDVLLITTRADGSIAQDPADPDVLIIAT